MRKVRLRVAERSGVERTVAGGLPAWLPENVCHCEPLVRALPREDVVALGEAVVALDEPVVPRREPVVARVEPVVRGEPAFAFAVAGDDPRARPDDPPKLRHSVPELFDVPERVVVPARVPPARAGSATAALVPPRDRPEALGNPAAPPDPRVALVEPLTDPVEPVPDDTAACEPRDRSPRVVPVAVVERTPPEVAAVPPLLTVPVLDRATRPAVPVEPPAVPARRPSDSANERIERVTSSLC